MQIKKEMNNRKRFTTAFKDLIILAVITIVVLVLSYVFNIFNFLVELFQKYPKAVTYIDEIITGLVVLSIGLAIFSWRRLRELKKETAKRIKLQEELIMMANIKAETERIISKQLHSEIELRKNEEKKSSFTRPDLNR